MLSAASGCGGDDDGGDGQQGAGVVTAPWDAYCVATFSEDTLVLDFGDPLFTARAGESYLMTSFATFGGETRADMAYLTPKGPYDFTVTAAAGTTLPFTSNCQVDQAKPYQAAFTDVSVFADEALTTKLCDLSAGTVVPASSGISGHSSTGLSFNGPETYQVYLNGFSASCGGVETGYVSVPETTAFGVTTWLVPIARIIGPS
jgi:hypothetical protein